MSSFGRVMGIVLIFVWVVGSNGVWAAPEVVRTISIEKPPENHFWHPHNKIGLKEGVFLGVKNDNRALIRQPDGEVIEVPLYFITPLDLSYILNRMAKFPEVSVLDYEPTREPLVSLSTENLSEGPLETWRNRGALGGAFHSMNEPPVVEEVQGRKGVRFDYSRWYIDPNYRAMTMDVLAPESLGEGKPFTLSCWVLHPEELDEDDPETLMSWHSIDGDNGTSVNFQGGDHVAGMGISGYHRRPNELHEPNEARLLEEWTHLAYVYEGGVDGKYRTYENGVLKRVSSADYLPTFGKPAEITASSATVTGELLSRDGKPKFVAVYLGKKDCHYWWQMRHVSYWERKNELGWVEPGEFSTTFKDLEPGTRYYYRMLAVEDTSDWESYTYTGRRWANGVGSFVTASEDGAPGEALPEDNDRHLFLGVHWGSRWYQSYSGPSGWYRGYIGDIRLYDHALNALEVRKEIGLESAYDGFPEDDASLDSLRVDLQWRNGARVAAKCRVYLSTDESAVEERTELFRETTQQAVPKVDLKPGARYFWRVEQVAEDGTSINPGDIWTFKVRKGEAFDPFPEDGSNVNLLGDFRWEPGGPHIREQRMYLGMSEEEVRSATEPFEVFRRDPRRAWMRSETYHPEALTAGKTYYWRIETVQEDGAVTSGEVWTFTVNDYFTPEFDGPVSEPYFEGMEPGRPGQKVMEGMGHPSISTPGADEEDLRRVSYGTDKFMRKSREFRRRAMAWPCGSTVGTFEGGSRGRGFHFGSYGGIPKWTLMLHEMGHQAHNILNRMLPDFQDRLEKVFDMRADTNAWLGDYAASNTGETMAVSCHKFTDADTRETLYREDPANYYLLAEYLPGDLYIDLHPAEGMEVDPEGRVRAWANRAGLDRLRDEVYEKIPGSVGTFAAIGEPMCSTTDGVTAISTSANDGLIWDSRTMLGLDENRAWSVEFWARRQSEKDEGAGTLFGWGSKADGPRFYWGDGRTAYTVGKDARGEWPEVPQANGWRHLVYVFEGGGLDNGKGALRVYLDGKEILTNKHQLDIDPDAPVFVGAEIQDGEASDGFQGQLAHVRVYNYDLSPEQVSEHYNEESAHYRRDRLHVAGKLLVDLDSHLLNEPGAEYHRPLYSERMGKRWIRSWHNHGTLQGRVHNDVHRFWGYSGSTPTYMPVAGVRAAEFDGEDRMVSVFEAGPGVVKNPPKTLEAWIHSEAQSEEETVLEWGDFRLESRHLQPGWQYVVVVFPETEGDAILYRNGGEVGVVEGSLQPREYDHLHMGAHYDAARWNWKRCFNGGIAKVRIHQGRLTSRQIMENFQNDALNRPFHPTPADGESVVASRKPAFLWRPGLFAEKRVEVFMGESPEALETVGIYGPGEFLPKLKPSRSYFWRAGDGPLWRFDTHKGAILEMDVADLREGPLAEWKNRGQAGGVFRVPESSAAKPEVKKFEGRKAVVFDGSSLLESNITTPEGLTDDHPFTVEMVAYAERESDARLFSFNRDSTGRHAAVGAGLHRNQGLIRGVGRTVDWQRGGDSRLSGEWLHLTWVYDGGARSRARLYRNGELNAEEEFITMDTLGGSPMAVGGAMTEEMQANAMFRGGIAKIRVYDYAKTGEEIAKSAAESVE